MAKVCEICGKIESFSRVDEVHRSEWMPAENWEYIYFDDKEPLACPDCIFSYKGKSKEIQQRFCRFCGADKVIETGCDAQKNGLYVETYCNGCHTTYGYLQKTGGINGI